jgi:hypothetical protein
MNAKIGTCSICGGDVVGHRGPWGSINPPPPASCTNCGATERRDIIEMSPVKSKKINEYDFTKDRSHK